MAGQLLKLDFSGLFEARAVGHGLAESALEGVRERETHGHSSLALAWSDDLEHWQWPY